MKQNGVKDHISSAYKPAVAAGLVLAALQAIDMAMRAGDLRVAPNASYYFIGALMLTASIMIMVLIGPYVVRRYGGQGIIGKNAFILAASAGAITGAISMAAALTFAFAEPLINGTTYIYPYSVLGGAFPVDLISYLILWALSGGNISTIQVGGYGVSMVALCSIMRLPVFALVAGLGGSIFKK